MANEWLQDIVALLLAYFTHGYIGGLVGYFPAWLWLAITYVAYHLLLEKVF